MSFIQNVDKFWWILDRSNKMYQGCFKNEPLCFGHPRFGYQCTMQTASHVKILTGTIPREDYQMAGLP